MKKYFLKKFMIACFLCTGISTIAQPKEILLWTNGAPGSEGETGNEKVRIAETGDHVISNIHHPSVALYLPAKDKANGTALIIAPVVGIASFGLIMKAIILQNG